MDRFYCLSICTGSLCPLNQAELKNRSYLEIGGAPQNNLDLCDFGSNAATNWCPGSLDTGEQVVLWHTLQSNVNKKKECLNFPVQQCITQDLLRDELCQIPWRCTVFIYLFIYCHLYSAFSIVQCSNALYMLWDGEIQGHTGQPSVREIDAHTMYNSMSNRSWLKPQLS